MAVIDRRQRLGDLRLVRAHVLAKVIQVADAGVGNVECAVGDDEYSFAAISRSNSSLLMRMGPSAALALTCDTSLVGL